eukprot:7767449-Alexandrium_andersonii.AAC.1
MGRAEPGGRATNCSMGRSSARSARRALSGACGARSARSLNRRAQGLSKLPHGPSSVSPRLGTAGRSAGGMGAAAV